MRPLLRKHGARRARRCLPAATSAHEMTMAEMELREIARGEFLWQWTASGNRPASQELTPMWPEAAAPKETCCAAAQDGLKGTMAIEGSASATRPRS